MMDVDHARLAAFLETIPTQYHVHFSAQYHARYSAFLTGLDEPRMSTPYTKLTWSDLKDAGVLGLDLRNIELLSRRRESSLSLPGFLQTVHPTEHLYRQLRRLERTWSQSSEAGRRTFVDTILAEAVDTFHHGLIVDDRSQAVESFESSMDIKRQEESGTSLRVFSEVELKWSGTAKGVMVSIDYVLGHAADDVEEGTKDSCLIAVEAKKEWPDSAVKQAIGKGGALLRYRQKNGKTGPVFVILTNASFWVFYCIDSSGVVYSSGGELVYSERTLPTILAWLRWFIMAAAVASPRTSTVDMTEDAKRQVERSLVAQRVKLWEKRSSGSRR
ncbi:hypothetical protein DFJ77DRAFT_457828 [Powellomyces hirtus]|nr:hypothetical protein DFJ77DRAFT_457828 [Powellomyces hirtus]